MVSTFFQSVSDPFSLQPPKEPLLARVELRGSWGIAPMAQPDRTCGILVPAPLARRPRDAARRRSGTEKNEWAMED